MNIQDSSSAALRKRRHHLARRLPPIEQILRGSLIETYKRCGRPNCHCVDGTGHGPKRYLSTISRTGERPRVGYVPNAAHAEVCEFLANFRKLREMLNEVCAINAELLRRRESLDVGGACTHWKSAAFSRRTLTMDSCTAAKPPLYSITSSAMASRPGGKVRPSALTVFKLMTNSNLVGCMTGKSSGFSPLRIRPV